MAERKNSEKRIASNNKWTNAHYDRVNLAIPKGHKDIIKAYADVRGESVNGFITRIIQEVIEQASKPTGSPQEAGGISLPPDALEAAREAAEAAGEALESFVARAVVTQAQQDRASLRMGIKPATGGKLEQSGKGGADHE